MTIIIKHHSDPSVTYQYLQFNYSSQCWAFCRDGRVVRWLDEYEENLIMSVLAHNTEENKKLKEQLIDVSWRLTLAQT